MKAGLFLVAAGLVLFAWPMVAWRGGDTLLSIGMALLGFVMAAVGAVLVIASLTDRSRRA
jgi:hypothetical protein